MSSVLVVVVVVVSNVEEVSCILNDADVPSRAAVQSEHRSRGRTKFCRGDLRESRTRSSRAPLDTAPD